ncbi:D-alanyl-D-alanine carboxypeptidase [bacterium]|nr:D-alanyl-D-alanine carboxypeptidase [bacterium]
MKISALIILWILISFNYSQAKTQLNTQCQKNESNGNVSGVNSNELFTIASVSKVFTTHWAVAKLSPKYRFQNKIHITPISKNIYDVHIEGDKFPYFDRIMFQFLAGELNKLGVKQINFLTYDENFEYASIVRTNKKLAHQYNDQDEKEIMQEMRKDVTTINANMVTLSARALALEKMIIPKSVSLTVGDIHFLAKKNFQPAGNTTSYLFESSELFRTLKEMNRNSHNFAADKIYEKLSEVENYRDFLMTRIKVTPAEISFFNGSGYPIENSEGKFYNKASCQAVVEMMHDLRKTLTMMQFNFQDVMAVAGKDAESDGASTVSQIYGNQLTSGALIAKTGTVADTITLAGLIITNEENIFFHTSYRYNGTDSDKDQAYFNIRSWINSILKKGGTDNNLGSYVPRAFFPFDSESGLKKIEPLTLP